MAARKKRWQKVLYLQQSYPDNYVPESFLRDLRKNVNFHWYSMPDIVLASLNVIQEISLVIIFVEFFWMMQIDVYQNTIYYTISILTIFLYPLLILSSSDKNVSGELRTGLIFIIGGFAVSPILKTLTETVSTDTIYTMSGIMLIVHLLFFDYGVQAAIVSPPLSINSVIFAGVCLASRLPTSYHTFALLTLVTDIFVVFPAFQRRLNQHGPPWLKFLIQIFVAAISFILMIHLGSMYASILYSILLLSICLFFPWRFHEWQRLKENIYGPWDEAILDLKAS
ncbi:phosphatidylinositol glycan anchor biosynthesis class C [Brevipalpus obovatus]|uniref:phosphatidylinositol glycan anchor biosynthesis class C n=1 Tax=Brevipalpus obovatus TaxID=246614 RepID=UPI003D9F62DD